MSKKNFTYSIVFMMLVFFAAVCAGCGGSSDGSSGGGFSLFTFNIQQDTGMPADGDTQSITYITNNTYTQTITNITQNVNTITTIINIENNVYDNTKNTSYDNIVASEDSSIPEPDHVTDTELSGMVYVAEASSGTDSADYAEAESAPTPISGARVIVSWGTAPDQQEVITTGADGKYTIKLDDKADFTTYADSSYATVTVSADAEGYKPFFAEVELEKQQPKEMNISLVRIQPASGVLWARNAQNNEAISGVSVKVLDGWNASDDAALVTEGTTDTEGKLSYSGISSGYYTVVMTKTDFTEARFNVTLNEGDDNTDCGYLSRMNLAEGEYRVVLTWGVYPTDLDSHIYGKKSSSTIHVYYANKEESLNGNTINLDRDDVTSYGPETITFKVDDTDTSYEYFIHWYSYASTYDWSRTEAKIDLYKSNEHIGTYTVPPAPDTNSGSYRYWRVFKIENGTLETLNSYTSTYSNITSSY